MKNTIELKWQANWLLDVEALDTIHQGMVDLINDLGDQSSEVLTNTLNEQEQTQAQEILEQSYQQINEKIDRSFLPLLQDLSSSLMQFIQALNTKDTRVRGLRYKTYQQGILTVLDELIQYVKTIRMTQSVDERCMGEIKYQFGQHMRSIAVFMRIYNAADPRDVTYLSGRQTATRAFG